MGAGGMGAGGTGGMGAGGTGGMATTSWSRRVGAGYVTAVEISNGDPLVIASQASSLAFGGTAAPVTGRITVAKASATDGLGIWASTIGQVANAETDYIGVNASITDATGDLYVGGSYKGSVTIGSESFTSGTEFSESNAFVAKVNGSTGAVLWAKSFAWYGGGSLLYNEADANVDLDLDASGRVVASFSTLYQNWHLPRVLLLEAATGNELGELWNPGSILYTGGTSTNSAATDATGSIAVAGYCNSCLESLTSCPWTLPAGSFGYVAVFNANLQCTGAAALPFRPAKVTSDGAGGWVVAGVFFGSFTVGSQTFTSAGGGDVAVTKLNGSLVHQWTKTIGGSETDLLLDLELTPNGNAMVTGRHQQMADLGGGVVTHSGDFDLFATWFSMTGSHLGARTWGTPETEWGYIRAYGSDIFVAATTSAVIDLGLGPLPVASPNGDIAYGRLPAP